MKITKFFKNLLITLMVILFMWFFISYMEIVRKNITPNPTYHSWNIIVNICDYCENNIGE